MVHDCNYAHAYSFVVYRSGEIKARKPNGNYDARKIKRPKDIKKQDIDTAILSALILAKG